jgi:two-component system response regulator DegU
VGDVQTLRIAITDDNEHFREALRDVLGYEPDFEIVAVWRNGAEVLREIDTVRPDILLLDINMPLLNGVEATKILRARCPDVRIIILSMHDDEDYVLETLRSGADGYLVKDGSVDEIVQAIREVAAGRAMVHPQVTQAVISQFHNGEEHQGAGDSWRSILTDREMDVLREMAHGLSTDEIAEALGISPKTVKNHIHGILDKLGAADRTQAVLIAVREGWLEL